jgi:uncharacterized protein YmfQ (DUF2313 family)
MSLTKDSYLNMLQSLMPPGKAINRNSTGNLTKLLDGLAEELARIDARCETLLTEMNPLKTSELITDWERLCALPTECTGPLDTIGERRRAILGVISGTGGQSIAYFIALAAAIGYTIEIVETTAHTFEVHGSADINQYFDVGSSSVGDALRIDMGADLLECVISSRKPAHAHITYIYDL